MASSGRPNVTEVELEPTEIEPGKNHFKVSLRASFSDEDIIAVNCISTLQRGNEYVQFEGLLSLNQGDSPSDGRWSGEVTIPWNMPDGDYSVICGIFVRGSGPSPFRQISDSILGNITLQRTTIPDNIPPHITALAVEPRIIGGPSNTNSYISVSATASDDVQVMLVYATGIQVSGSGRILGPPDAPYMSLEEGDFETGNGRWGGKLLVHRLLANGEYRIDFYAFDAKGNFARSSESPTIKIDRADVVSPTIVASSITVDPKILRPRESQVALSVRATDREGVQSVAAYVTPGSTGSTKIGAFNLQRSGGTALNGIWTGSFAFPPNAADGEYRVTFNAADMAGNSTSGGPVSVTLQRQEQGQQTPQNVPATESSTTFTFPGPATIQNITSESGECEIRVSVPRRVIIDCECPQKTGRNTEESTGSKPVPATERNEKAATTITFPGPATIQNITSESGECEIRVSVPRRVVIDCECPQKSATEPEPFINPPKVVSTSPADQQRGIPVSSIITAYFSKQMDPSTMSVNTFTVTRGSSTNTINGTVSLSQDGKVGAYHPGSPLDEYTSYTAKISDRAKDLAGNPMDGDYSWSFTTEQITPG